MSQDLESKKSSVSGEIGLVEPETRLVVDSHSTQTSQKRDPFIGTILGGRYEILSLLGRGATTSVYKASDCKVDRFVAVKLLRNDAIFNEQATKRFHQETATLGLLKHHNIVSLYGSGVADGDNPYLVMEFVEGVSLKELIEERSDISVERILNIFVQVCAALAAAHEKGVVHRDMKPANIMIAKTQDGKDQVKVLDFGVAKLLVQGETFQTKTQTGEMLGTLLYMSPEQCLEQSLDPRSDIYSVGCVLYETLTGTPPLIGRTAFETMNKHLTQMPARLSTVRPDLVVSYELEEVVRKALAKNVNERYQTIQQMQSALAALQPKHANLLQKADRPLTVINDVARDAKLDNEIWRCFAISILGLLIVFSQFYWTVVCLVMILLLFLNHLYSDRPSTSSERLSEQKPPATILAAPAVTTEEASIRAGTISFLAMESMDKPNWSIIYADKLEQHSITESDVLQERLRLQGAEKRMLGTDDE